MKNASQELKSDQASIASKESSLTKTPVYVHRYLRNTLKRDKTYDNNQQRNIYTNGFQKFYFEKSQYYKNRFDGLSLARDSSIANKVKAGMNYNAKSKPEYASHAVNTRLNNNCPIDKMIIQKIEEKFWADWKPKNKRHVMIKRQQHSPDENMETEKNTEQSGDVAQVLGLSTDPIKNLHEDDDLHYINEHFVLHDSQSSENGANASSDIFPYQIQNIDTGTENDFTNLNIFDNKQEGSSLQNTIHHSDTMNTIEPIDEDISKDSSTEVESIPAIKHTDSFILNKKQQCETKPRYQQPKCIKLHKNNYNAVDKKTLNFVKGGSYPLKSCLKTNDIKKKTFHQSNQLSSQFLANGSVKLMSKPLKKL